MVVNLIIDLRFIKYYLLSLGIYSTDRINFITTQLI